MYLELQLQNFKYGFSQRSRSRHALRRQEYGYIELEDDNLGMATQR